MKRTFRRAACAALLLIVQRGAIAHDYALGPIAIEHPHARPTAPAQPTGGGYLALTNRGASVDRLVSASAPSVAQRVELHTMRMEGDVMRMREVGGVDLPPGRKVTLEPGGVHLMLLGLKAPLVAGQRFPMSLTFEKAGRIDVDVTVDAATAPAGAPAASMEHRPGMH